MTSKRFATRRLRARIAGTAGMALLIASCAGTATRPPASDPDLRCVVDVAPAMRMVTFAPAAGLDGGVTSLFFRQMPDVHVGDLVRMTPGGNGRDASLERREAASPSCQKVVEAATSHHGSGHPGGHAHH